MQAMPAVRGVTQETPTNFPRPVVEAISRPARTFTGDFYLTHRHGERLWFALGDVAGKGLPAAVFMAMIQEELEHRIAACAATECEPSRTVQRLHEFLRPILHRTNRFATAVIGWLHDDGTLRLTNAGHPSPLLVRRDGTIEAFPSTGPLLGILPNAAWSSHNTRLERGETLVLYSDGLSEALDEDEELGVPGLTARLAQSTSTDDVLKCLTLTDDLTIIVMRR